MIYIIKNDKGDVQHKGYFTPPKNVLGEFNGMSDCNWQIFPVDIELEDIEAMKDKMQGLYKKLNSKDAVIKQLESRVMELQQQMYIITEVDEC